MKRLVSLLIAMLLLTACTGATSTPAPAVATISPTSPTAGGATATVRPSTTPVGGSAPSATPASTPGASGSAPATPVRRADNVTDVPNTTPAAAQALVEQAIGLVLDHYVDSLQVGLLYQAAYAGALATLQASGVSPQAQALTLTGDRKRDAATFKTAYLTLTERSGPTINQSVVAYAAIESLVEQVDECHTYFLDPVENKRAKAAEAGQESYTGIGVLINSTLRPATITKVYRDSPAEKGGLREGDAIIAVDDTDVSDLPVDQVSPLVRGPENSQVRLTIRRPGEPTPLVVTLTRAKINIPVFDKEILNGPNGEKIGYMELDSFSAPTTRFGLGDGVEKDIQAALESFEKEGVSYWILDLRNNPGGYVDILARVAGRFIKDGKPVAYTVDTGGKTEAIATDRRDYFKTQHPLAVLINGGSGSSSEAFAAAAQDYRFARLFGQTTAGCLAAAQSFDLADGSGLSITVQKVVSPNRREINRVGVKPDEDVPANPSQPNDPVRDAAIRWLVAQPQPAR